MTLSISYAFFYYQGVGDELILTSGDINIKNNNRLAQNVLKIKTTSGDISVR